MPAKQRNVRKSRALTGDDDEADDSINLYNLQDIKFQQQQRKRTAGLDSSTLATGDGPSHDGRQPNLSDELMETYVKAKPIGGISNEEDPHMKAFIEKELQRRRGKEEEDDEDPAAAKRRRREEELYAVPETLKGNSRPVEVVIPGLLTGITEVALPMAARLQSIENTEAVKRNLLYKASRGPQDSDDEEEGGKGKKGPLHRGQFARSFGKSQQRKKS